ncbi:hypothetical protein HMPREF1979_00543 [Actinomyces johnsonii F0542]|uniref:Uncharacterized protein n=1 Tax=Actinomyces johnsonii F0542 TaxID=1321818 RepID=U1S0I1_9ACTO|nr:hypothetical protein HMPREF1979_00543 [Actinomyces johnsonii F0542]
MLRWRLVDHRGSLGWLRFGCRGIWVDMASWRELLVLVGVGKVCVMGGFDLET